ncbi:uncharacterized protein PADG_03815 [Paracoccidioides brasiliensis Pb18]|uniref:Vacuolar membrane protein n=1 Tax=Paracoccidioides brasiliensis (strain Pb18) TaxID=502780 RepID=C1G979_PARBD|nr:uncharacterized protein PADG_03815 [Paracoccidioides brasiliensis Pb18]EEH47731.2 hypothetical protein PADG_03815 [Paracoccidioides brasiliensis Pb18]
MTDLQASHAITSLALATTHSLFPLSPSSSLSLSPSLSPPSFLQTMRPSPVSAATSSPSPSPPPTPSDDNNGECQLLGPFALLVQVTLGALALLALVYKRWRERPQRPIKVWAFDVSKQVFGSAMLHLANLLASMFSAGQIPVTATYQPNPCSYYLLNLGIDTTLGIPILILILRVLNHAALFTPLANPPESIQSGNYGSPPRATWWFKQSMIYFVGLLCMKTCVIILIHMLPFIVKVGDWALRWTEGNTAVQIFFVMLLFPVIMNAVQYYIIDTFIKKPSEKVEDGEGDDNEDGGSGNGAGGVDGAGGAGRYDSLDDVVRGDDRHRRSALLAGIDRDDLNDEDYMVFPDDDDDEGRVKRTLESGGGGDDDDDDDDNGVVE